MPANKQTYRAHGKLLLTAEYFVLLGAKAIALPVKYGQQMVVSNGVQEEVLSWKAFREGNLWLSCDFHLPDLKIMQGSDAEKAGILRDTLKAIQEMKPDFTFQGGLDIHTKIDFDSEWGFGSSSTLIANLAAWAGVDPFQLNERIFHGSGFDIACANADGPIIYKRNEKPVPVDLAYPFRDHLFFVYSGSKKSTRGEVRRFLERATVTAAEIEKVNCISEELAKVEELSDFQKLIFEHEQLVSRLLDVPTVKSQFFNDFNGEIKSLGAWGGDFYLAATPLDEREVRRYFNEKGLSVVFPWGELVLNNR